MSRDPRETREAMILYLFSLLAIASLILLIALHG